MNNINEARGQNQMNSSRPPGGRRLLAKGAAVDVVASGPGAQKPPGAAAGGASDVRGAAEVRLRCLMQHTTTTWSAKLLLAAKASVDIKRNDGWNDGWGPQPMSQPF